jgi:ATP-dependent Lon protease
LTTLIIPRDNEKDLADIAKNVLDTFEIHRASHVDEVLKIALAEPLQARPPTVATAVEKAPGAITH